MRSWDGVLVACAGLVLSVAFQVLIFKVPAWASKSPHFNCIQLLQQQGPARESTEGGGQVRYFLDSTTSADPAGDFELREKLPQTEVPRSFWCHERFGSFGPCPSTYPRVKPLLQPGQDPLNWARERVILAAKRYIGLPYAHLHIPGLGGLDCSNFTAWVYNFAFGIRFSSHIENQAQTAGTRLGKDTALEPGDLIFLWNSAAQEHISHVAIYVSPDWVLDAAPDGGIQIRAFKGRYKNRWAWTRRIISERGDF